MADRPQSIISRVSVGTNDFEAATAFYDAVLTPLGCKRVIEFPGSIAYGKDFPEFWIGGAHDGKPASAANGVHFAFLAGSSEEVDAFHAAAIAAGGTDDGAPGLRPEYTENYDGAFVRDLDGHKIEAMCLV